MHAALTVVSFHPSVTGNLCGYDVLQSSERRDVNDARKTDKPNLQKTTSSSWYRTLVVVLVCVLPALSAADVWDSYLSFSLYSGNLSTAFITLSRADAWELSKHSVWTELPSSAAGTSMMMGELTLIAVWEINVVPYPEIWVHRRIVRELCRKAIHPEEILLRLQPRRTLFDWTAKPWNESCADLT